MLSNLIAQATAQMVSDVMINGEFFLRKRQVMTYAEEDLKIEYREILERFSSRTGVPPMSEPGIRPASDEIQEATPILPLPTTLPAVQQQDSEDVMSEPFEEGFRIVGANEPTVPPAQNPEHEEKESDRELPKTVRRVFGDEDI
jgi:hypothetical protein